MTAWSKVLTCSCYELGHTWEPSCQKAIAEVARHGYKEAIKIYLPLYLITAILRKRKKRYYLTRLAPEVLRSTLFLGTNAFSFIAFFCLWRRNMGYFIRWHMYLCSLPTLATIAVIERSDRRVQLAVYMLNVATETVWRMLANRKLVKPIKNGQVLIFCVVSSIYMYLFKCRDGLQDSTLSAFKFLVGNSECPPPLLNEDPVSPKASPKNNNSIEEEELCSNETEQRETPVRSSSPPHSPTQHSYKSSQSQNSVLGYLPREIQVLVHQFRNGRKHAKCRHRNGCMATVVEGFLRMFGIGYGIQAALKLLRALTQVFRKPSGLLSALTHSDNFKLGAFLGCYAGIFKLTNCLLRWIRNKESEAHGLVSGFLAGTSMMFWKSTTMAMFLASKLAETLYMKGIDNGIVPYIKYGEILVYTISTSIVFHAAVFEPHSLRPAYWKFLLQMTNGRGIEFNRKIFDVYGTQASKLNPELWPKLDPKYSNFTQGRMEALRRLHGISE